MARTTTEHNIVVQSAKPYGVTRLESVGTAKINPGDLVEIESNGKLQKHSLVNGFSAKFVALENQTPDTDTYPTTAAIDIAYDSDDTVYFAQLQAGDVANMWIASGQNVTKGLDTLFSDGSGRLVAAASGTGSVSGTCNPIGIPWEDANASGGTAIRCKVRII